MATIECVREAYELGKGQWSGCNWTTAYGRLSVNLDGVSSRQAHQAGERWLTIAQDLAACDVTAYEELTLYDMAVRLRLDNVGHGSLGACPRRRPLSHWTRRHCAEALAREWKVAAFVLAEIERDAHRAEQEARKAVRAAEGGDWERALLRVQRACLIESGYDAPRPWARLRRVIEQAVL